MTSPLDPGASAQPFPAPTSTGEAETGGFLADYLSFLRTTRRWWWMLLGMTLVLILWLLYLTLAEISPPPDLSQ